MSPSTYPTSLDLFQTLTMGIHSRRLLLNTPLFKQPPADTAGDSGTPESSFDANIVMILAILLCAIICSLCLNSILRCAIRCTNRMAIEPESNSVARHTASMRRKAVRSLPFFVYSAGQKLPGAGAECAICLSDFVAGESVRILPGCKHAFHVRCVDRWLLARPSCPTCRRSLLSSRKKASGEGLSCSGMGQFVIVPLEHEALVANYI